MEELANFIQQSEPNIKGFTPRNLWRMKQFYEAYKDNKKLTTLLTEISWSNNLLILSSTKNDKRENFIYSKLLKKNTLLENSRI